MDLEPASYLCCGLLTFECLKGYLSLKGGAVLLATLLLLLLLRAYFVILGAGTDLSYLSEILGPSHSTLGLLLYWWDSNRQHSSRGTTTIRNVESLPVLDLRAFSEEQLSTSEAIFDELREMELKPAYLADIDSNRALLDRRVVCELLGFDKGVYEGVRKLSAKWCAEPSVHGGKARPKATQLVI